jgi:hypothetical protein
MKVSDSVRSTGSSVMKSVPPRGSGRVSRALIDNPKPTRYRVVVLTSLHR